MRILHVLECLSPRFGGPVSMLKALACAQANAGHQVTVCTTNRDHPSGTLRPAGKDVICDGVVEVHYFPVQVNALKISLHLARFLNTHIADFDIVHVHGLYRFPSTYAAWRARKLGVPYVVCPHGSLAPYLHRRSSRSVSLKRLYECWFDLPNLHGAGAVHYTTEEERRGAAFLHLRAPSFVVPNGIDWARFASLPARGAFRAARGLGDAPVALFLGRLHESKGLDLLIPAFASVRRTVPDACLVLVGPDNDDYGRQVRMWVHERGLDASVLFGGFLDGADVLRAYVDADVFVSPSYTESFGMTVVEAMACALPVVISDQVNIHHEIAAAGAGIVTPCAVEAVAIALSTLLRDRALATAMGSTGRRVALEQYTWPPIVQALTREYESVIAHAPAEAMTEQAAGHPLP